MPSLLGRSRDEVNAILDALRTESEIDFSWVFQDQPTEDATFDGAVLSTSPDPGGKVDKTTRIVVVIGTYSAPADDGGG